MSDGSALVRNISDPGNRTLRELFQNVAECHPDATAIVGENQSLSYAELSEQADWVAHRLRGLGMRDGAAVGVLIERSVELVIALVAVIKAGGCYIALDHKQPVGRTAALLRDAGANFLITRRQYQSDQLEDLKRVFIASPGEVADPYFDEFKVGEAVHAADMESIAYIAYTSGSTGFPKGVCVPHRAVTRLVIDADYLPIRSDDVFLQLAPVAFDASTLEIWGAILNGATLVVAPSTDLSASTISSIVRDHKVTVLFLTAGLFHQLGPADFEKMGCLRFLITGGELVSVTQVNRAFSDLRRSTVIHAYGPTENTTFTTCYPIKTRVTSTFVPLGSPIDGSVIYLLNDHLEPVRRGEIGELFAAGRGLAHGYVNNPSLTAEKFLPNPFTNQIGAYMYRTGDLARQSEDGALEFVGRADNQIKIRGFRVEPAEVEAALQLHSDIETSCVVLQRMASNESQLVAFYICEDPIPTAELRRLLSVRLPQYMIPSRFIRLDELPLKSNGKVDRNVLIEMRQSDRPDIGAEFRPAETPIGKWLAQLWSDLLEISAVGVDDDFFELGGHSLLAVRLTSEIGVEFDIDISAQEFYENPTVEELAAVLKGRSVKFDTFTGLGEV